MRKYIPMSLAAIVIILSFFTFNNVVAREDRINEARSVLSNYFLSIQNNDFVLFDSLTEFSSEGQSRVVFDATVLFYNFNTMFIDRHDAFTLDLMSFLPDTNREIPKYYFEDHLSLCSESNTTTHVIEEDLILFVLHLLEGRFLLFKDDGQWRVDFTRMSNMALVINEDIEPYVKAARNGMELLKLDEYSNISDDRELLKAFKLAMYENIEFPPSSPLEEKFNF